MSRRNRKREKGSVVNARVSVALLKDPSPITQSIDEIQANYATKIHEIEESASHDCIEQRLATALIHDLKARCRAEIDTIRSRGF